MVSGMFEIKRDSYQPANADRAPRPRRRAVRASLALPCVLLVVALTACQSTPGAGQKTESLLPPPNNLTTRLEDEVRDLDGGKIRWSTYWKLCWEPAPRAAGYELETVTAEGASPKLKRQSGTCFRLEIAAGENHNSAGLLHREQLIAVQKGQLAYRVRTVLDNHQRSEWSSLRELGR